MKKTMIILTLFVAVMFLVFTFLAAFKARDYGVGIERGAVLTLVMTVYFGLCVLVMKLIKR